jgi:hypothetical protein
MKPMKIVAGLAIAGGLAAGAVGVGAGAANADPGQGLGPVPVDWRPRRLLRGRAADRSGTVPDRSGVVPVRWDGVPRLRRIPSQEDGTAAGNRTAGCAYSTYAYRTGAPTKFARTDTNSARTPRRTRRGVPGAGSLSTRRAHVTSAPPLRWQALSVLVVMGVVRPHRRQRSKRLSAVGGG